MKKVIILNGPPSSGKDTYGKYILKTFGGNHLQFKDRLFEHARQLSNTTKDQWREWYRSKENPVAELDGMSPRQYLIHVSEDVCKPLFGEDYFGQAAANQLVGGINIFTDGGFVSELMALVDKVGAENVLVLRLYRDGCSFDNDSRDYLPDIIGTECHDIEIKSRKIEEIYPEIHEIVDSYINNR